MTGEASATESSSLRIARRLLNADAAAMQSQSHSEQLAASHLSLLIRLESRRHANQHTAESHFYFFCSRSYSFT